MHIPTKGDVDRALSDPDAAVNVMYIDHIAIFLMFQSSSDDMSEIVEVAENVPSVRVKFLSIRNHRSTDLSLSLRCTTCRDTEDYKPVYRLRKDMHTMLQGQSQPI